MSPKSGDMGHPRLWWMFQKGSWGRVWSPMSPKTGRHGAPEIVEAYFRKTRGGRVWFPMSPKPGDMGHPRLWKLISERLVGEGCGFPCLQNRETWGTRDCGCFRKARGGRVWSPMSPKSGDMGHRRLWKLISERLVGEGCGFPCLQVGRHGAPEIVRLFSQVDQQVRGRRFTAFSGGGRR
jgi:hypothetical protein